MKKIIIFLLSAWIAIQGYAATSPKFIVSDSNESEAIAISPQMNLIPKTQHLDDKNLYAVIQIDTPELSGIHLSPQAKKFNQSVKEIVVKLVEDFKRNVQLDQIHLQTLPESKRHNSLHIDYDVDFVKPGNRGIVSVRITAESLQAGRPHAYHVTQVLNFDLAKGRALTLSELFKPKTNYLTVIAHYSNQKLKETLKDKWMIEEGTKPLLKNYKNWNVDPDGIIITFDEYQVSDVRQEVTIPYQALKSSLSSKVLI